jgi:hypothetical protein
MPKKNDSDFYHNFYYSMERLKHGSQPAVETACAMPEKISRQDAVNRGMFGPVYHGTTEQNRRQIEVFGFKVFYGETGHEGMTHGYPDSPYYDGVPAPEHHLGYGVYFTTSKTIGKHFNQGTTVGLKTYYLDAPRLLEINFGAASTMMKWWTKNGHNPAIAKLDRMLATKMLTDKLSHSYDAVWYKGTACGRRLLDGDQVCVYDPSRIYEIDDHLAGEYESGSKVKRNSDGMIGVVLKSQRVEDFTIRYPGARSWLGDAKYHMTVRWRKGGTQYNVTDKDVTPYKR